MQRFVFVVLAFLACGQAWAAKLVQTQAWVVGTHISEQGESRDAFVLRLAGVMQAWTDEHGAEVCGYLATDGERWGVKLTTQRSQVMCITDPALVPEGFRAEPDSIHTHPSADEKGWLEITAQTEQAALAVGDMNLHRLRSGKAPRAVLRVKAQEGFSDDDFNVGSGFLVVNGTLLYQAGRRKVSDLGRIKDN